VSPQVKKLLRHPAYVCASIEAFSTIPSMEKKCFVLLHLGNLMAKSLDLDIRERECESRERERDRDETRRRSE